jgi:hypothetical protein
MSQTSEAAFETNLVNTLTSSGWHTGQSTAWDVDAALFPQVVTGKTDVRNALKMVELEGAKG